MKTLILCFSIVLLILSESTTLAQTLEPKATVAAQSPDLQPAGAEAIVSLGDVEAAKASMEQARIITAQDLIMALASVADFRSRGTGFESLWIEDSNVIISGSFQGDSNVVCSEKFSQLQNELEKYLKSVQVIGREETQEGLRFALKLFAAPDFIDCLISQKIEPRAAVSQRESVRKVWQKAEEEKQKAEEHFGLDDYNAAAKAFKQAETLFLGITHSGENADSIQRILDLQYSLANLNGELHALHTDAFPDTILFKDGRKIKCEILAEASDSIRINSETGATVIPQAQIDSIDNVSQENKQQEQKLQAEIQKTQKELKEFKPVLADLQEGLVALLRDNTVD